MADTKGNPKRGKRAASPADPAEVREAGAVVNPGTAAAAASKRAASPARPRAAGPTTPKGGGAKGKGRGESYAESTQRRKAAKETDRLQEDLRDFAAARPAGWGHDDWLSFLDTLKERGHDTSDPEGIGRRLERERLATVLGTVQGLGPRRVEALTERFETVWSARHAGVDEVASVPGIPRALAERVVEALRSR